MAKVDDLEIVRAEKLVGEKQGWNCGACGKYVPAPTAVIAHVLATATDGAEFAVPVLVHGECAEGLRLFRTWGEWVEHARTVKPAEKQAALKALRAALEFWGVKVD